MGAHTIHCTKPVKTQSVSQFFINVSIDVDSEFRATRK